MKNRNNGSRIFLTELMFSIFFFIIVAAICVQAFAGSFAKSKEAGTLTQAVNVATNAAEEYLTNDDFSCFTQYYDDNWQKIDDGSNATYKATGIVTDPEKKGKCQSIHLVVSTIEDEEIYSIVVEKALKE